MLKKLNITHERGSVPKIVSIKYNWTSKFILVINTESCFIFTLRTFKRKKAFSKNIELLYCFFLMLKNEGFYW